MNSEGTQPYLYPCSCAGSVTQSCPTVCDLMDCSAPGSMEFSRQEYRSRLPFPTPGDLPNPGLEPASRVFPALIARFFTTSQPGNPPCCAMLSRFRLCVTLWTVACQAPLSMGFGILQARILEQFSCPPPGDLPSPGTEPASLVSLALADGFFIASTTHTGIN